MGISRLPGTTIEADMRSPERAMQIFTPLFDAGGLVLSQVSSLTGMPPYQVQNWVKRGFVSPPKHKRYTVEQFSRIAIINMLKDSMQIEKIVALINYLNTRPPEGGAAVDDSELYIVFTEISLRVITDGGYDEQALERELKELRVEPEIEPRLKNVLRVMIMAHAVARMRQDVEQKMLEIV